MSTTTSSGTPPSDTESERTPSRSPTPTPRSSLGSPIKESPQRAEQAPQEDEPGVGAGEVEVAVEQRPTFPPGQDEAYTDFFRIHDPTDEPDKLSLLACRRQGIHPEELLAKCPEDFAAPGRSAEKQRLRYERYKERRSAAFEAVEKERHDLLLHLLSKIKNRRSLPATSQVVQGLQSPGKSGTAMVEQQIMSDILASTQPRDGSAGTKRPTDVDRFLQRELRQLNKQREREQRLIEIQQNMAYQEEQRQRAERRRNKEREREVQNRQMQRLLKLESVRLVAQELYDEGKQRAAERARIREEHEERYARELDESRKRKQEDAQAQIKVVQERARQNHQIIEQQSELQRKSLIHKMTIHEERKRNILLKKAKSREEARIAKLHKAIAVSEALAEKEYAEQTKNAELLDKHTTAGSRIAKQRAELMDRIQSKIDEDGRNLSRVYTNKEQLKRKREERLQEMIERHCRKEEYLRRKERDIEEQRGLRAEKNQIRLETTFENQRRIRQQMEYKAQEQAAIIEEGTRAKAEADARRRRKEIEYQHMLMETLRTKEKVRDEIGKLRLTPLSPAPACTPTPPSLGTLEPGRVLMLDDRQPKHKSKAKAPKGDSPTEKLFKVILHGNTDRSAGVSPASAPLHTTSSSLSSPGSASGKQPAVAGNLPGTGTAMDKNAYYIYERPAKPSHRR